MKTNPAVTFKMDDALNCAEVHAANIGRDHVPSKDKCADLIFDGIDAYQREGGDMMELAKALLQDMASTWGIDLGDLV
jgi:hypothetical protein